VIEEEAQIRNSSSFAENQLRQENTISPLERRRNRWKKQRFFFFQPKLTVL